MISRSAHKSSAHPGYSLDKFPAERKGDEAMYPLCAHATSCPHRASNYAYPSPRAVVAPFQAGAAAPDRQHCHHSKRCRFLSLISGTGRTPPWTRREYTSSPRRCRTIGPGQTHEVEVAGNSPVSSHGCKSPLPVANRAAGKPSFNASGRKTYFRYSSQGCIRARLHPGPHQPAIRRMDRGLRPVAPHRDLELIWNGVVDTSGGRR